MKVEDYNPKAKEAFGKSLVDIGVAIFKALILLVTVVPVTIIFKISLEGNTNNDFSILNLFANMSPITYLTLLAFIISAFVLGHLFRSQGLKYIHKSQE